MGLALAHRGPPQAEFTQSLCPGLTSGAEEAGGAGVLAVGRGALGAVVASRAGEAGGLASQVAVGASRTGLGEAGPPGAEVASGTGAPLL